MSWNIKKNNPIMFFFLLQVSEASIVGINNYGLWSNVFREVWIDIKTIRHNNPFNNYDSLNPMIYYYVRSEHVCKLFPSIRFSLVNWIGNFWIPIIRPSNSIIITINIWFSWKFSAYCALERLNWIE